MLTFLKNLGQSFSRVVGPWSETEPPEFDDLGNYGALVNQVARTTGKHPAAVMGILCEYLQADRDRVYDTVATPDVVQQSAQIVAGAAASMSTEDYWAVIERYSFVRTASPAVLPA